MEFITKTFNGIEYECRLITDLQNEGQRLVVAPEKLAEVLKNKDGEFDQLDDEIFAYADDYDLYNLSDGRLFDLFA